MFADEPYPLYNRIALPPLLRKQVAEAKVIIRDVAWHEKHAIDLRLGTRVEAIDHEGKTVTAAGKEWPFDALLVATGGRPNPADAPGAAGAHNFQYMDDTKAISETLETAKTAVSVGGSFIAYELAEAFVSRGVETHWLIRGPRFLRRMLDEISGELLDEAARADGCIIHYNDEVKSFARSNGVITKVVTKQGAELSADLVGIGLGLTINTELVHGTPIEVGTGIRCDDRLETAVKGIYAAGDAAEFYDPIADMHYRMGTWNNAGAHGKVAAANMAGGDVRYHDVPEYSSNTVTTSRWCAASSPTRSGTARCGSARSSWSAASSSAKAIVPGSAAISMRSRRRRSFPSPSTSRCSTGTPTPLDSSCMAT
jgi:3-phenylpropionate/trans-cinnamate dioxygenase ferredoxin reductase subunit